MSARRWIHLCVAGGLLAGMASPLPSQAAAGSLASGVTASADAAVGTFHPYSTLAAPDVVFAQLGVSHAELDSTPHALGIAGPFYVPVAGLVGLLGLPPVPPQVMPYCQSYFPTEPSSASCVGPHNDTGGVAFAVGNGQTHSGGDFTDLSKLFSTASVRVGGLESKGFSVGAGWTAASVRPAGGRWTAGTSLELEHLAVGDVLTIDSIASAATATLNGEPGTGTASQRLVITGAKVGRQPVDITPDGVVVGGRPGIGTEETKALQAAVDSALKSANLTVRLLPGGSVQVTPDGTSVVADSGGIVVAFTAPRPVPPSSGEEVIFGRSVVRMSAYNSDLAGGGLVDIGPVAGASSSESPATATASARGDVSPGGASTTPPAPMDGSSSVNGALGSSGGTTGASSGGGKAGNPPYSAALSAAQPAVLRDGAGLGVRHIFLLVGILAVVGPLLIIARRIRLVFGG